MWNDLLDSTFIEEYWSEAAELSNLVLESLFDAAHEVCVAYAPLLPAEAPVPVSYKLAEIMQARHIWTQFAGGNRDEMGTDGFTVTVYPLVFAARDLLRPKTSPLRKLGR
ncbi:hypothetical protein [Arthrobacter sp. U41]|uniref:hypothetical protein n=1 Tax=Arthrobacter sp. U41 TaxID=1849032 RepID=UPI0008592DC5|nr:hypothetical protein [Arthrobacter sp. U41]AOT04956.1 hypothetical protein ASPU41_18170 [Arthrobacter sp. U41]